jgi:hypothetical protein
MEKSIQAGKIHPLVGIAFPYGWKSPSNSIFKKIKENIKLIKLIKNIIIVYPIFR